MLAAQAVFKASPGPNAAAAAVGAMLTRWHYIALLAPLLLFSLEWRRNRATVIALLFSALTLAAAQGMVDLRIRQIREGVPYGVSSLEPGDPLRRLFGKLHGISMSLMALQVLAATAVVAMNARRTVYFDEEEAVAADQSLGPSVPELLGEKPEPAAPGPEEPPPPPARVVDEPLEERPLPPSENGERRDDNDPVAT